MTELRDHGNFFCAAIMMGVCGWVTFQLDQSSDVAFKLVLAALTMYATWHLAMWTIARSSYVAYPRYLVERGFSECAWDYDSVQLHAKRVAPAPRQPERKCLGA